MFKALYPIARHTQLSIIVTPAGEKLSLIIIPRPDGTKEEQLGKPIQVTGTPEELDAELPAKLAEFCEAYNGVVSNLGGSIEALNAAKDKAAKRKPRAAGKTAKKKAARPSPPKPTKKKAARPSPPKPKRVDRAAAKPAAARAGAAAPAADMSHTAMTPAADWPFPTR